MFDLNVLGLILTSQAVVKHFDPDGGSIVNISSVAATAAPPNASVYSNGTFQRDLTISDRTDRCPKMAFAP